MCVCVCRDVKGNANGIMEEGLNSIMAHLLCLSLSLSRSQTRINDDNGPVYAVDVCPYLGHVLV